MNAEEFLKLSLLGKDIFINPRHIIQYEIINKYEAMIYISNQKPIKLYRESNQEFEIKILKL